MDRLIDGADGDSGKWSNVFVWSLQEVHGVVHIFRAGANLVQDGFKRCAGR